MTAVTASQQRRPKGCTTQKKKLLVTATRARWSRRIVDPRSVHRWLFEVKGGHGQTLPTDPPSTHRGHSAKRRRPPTPQTSPEGLRGSLRKKVHQRSILEGISVNLYQCLKCECLRWMETPTERRTRSRCLGKTYFGYKEKRRGAVNSLRL